ncbi:MAG: peptide chain release factor N(5)-glutamine methyltransferase [Nitrospira sp.]|nr:peptide chain release factor N(5)-glutamine methyltransferase [Nitrospira sp.]
MAALVMPERKTVGALLSWARQALIHAGISNAAQEATWLLEHALAMRRHQLVSEAEQPVSSDAWTRAEILVARRVAREPLQYVLGTQEFCGLEFSVSPAVLIPRPETELLVRQVCNHVQTRSGAILVDVGTGSGCLAITLATRLTKPRIFAIDRSSDALAVAKTNAARHAVLDRIEWLEGDLLAPLLGRVPEGSVDAIVSNPPYISESDWAGLEPEVRVFEPRMALVGGVRGTELHERLLSESRKILAPEGVLVMEIGAGQAPMVRQVAAQVGGYAPLRIIEDAAGIERVVVAQRVE